jgi:hypothetical protein
MIVQEINQFALMNYIPLDNQDLTHESPKQA